MELILAYTTCSSAEEAKKLGDVLLAARLCACYNVLPAMESASFWPPQTDAVERATESVLLLKTARHLFADLEVAISQQHTYELPCIFAMPMVEVSMRYRNWLEGELGVRRSDQEQPINRQLGALRGKVIVDDTFDDEVITAFS